MPVVKKVEVLLVDDDKVSSSLVANSLDKANFPTTVVTTAEQAISLLSKKSFPIIISDIAWGGPDGLTIIPYANRAKQPCLIIFMTGHGSLSTAGNSRSYDGGKQS